MGRSAQRRIDEIGDESRRRILDAAEELFAERGFERTSFVDIAERSGISRGSIPWHFKNKDGLVMAVTKRAIERSMPQSRYTDMPPMSQVLSDYAALARQGSPRLLFMIMTEAMDSTDTLHGQYCEYLEERRADTRRWFRARRPADVDPDEAAEREQALSAVVNGALIGIQMQEQIDPENVNLERALSVLASLIDGQVDELFAGVRKARKRSSTSGAASAAAPGA